MNVIINDAQDVIETIYIISAFVYKFSLSLQVRFMKRNRCFGVNCKQYFKLTNNDIG